MRRSLNDPAEFRGIGLHGGQPVHMAVHPAEAGTGIVFIRTDEEAGLGKIPALFSFVSDTKLCTKLTNEHGVSVGTVEHIMAALVGSGITDAVIRLDGPEVPIMDGSSLTFVETFRRIGLRDLNTPTTGIRVLKPIEVQKDGKRAALLPNDTMQISVDISFDDEAIGDQSCTIALSGGAFADELAECRTFGRLAEVEHLRRHGLARGGGLENAIVVDDGRVLNPGGLRRPDEFVRHKMLDAVGDLALAGHFILGRYEGEKSGHELTNLLLHKLFSERDAWCLEQLNDALLPDLRLARFAIEEPDQQIAV